MTSTVKVVAGLIVILVFGVYIIYVDITNIAEKNLITDKNLTIDYKHQKFTVNSEILKKILDDKNNKWTVTFATYACPMHIRGLKSETIIDIGNDFVVINYQHRLYGYVQVISRKKVPDILNNLIQACKNLDIIK